jgi:copper chaperone
MNTSIIRKTTLRSNDLNCPSCVSRIERELQGMDGVSDAKVFFSTGRIDVRHDPQRVTNADLVRAVGNVGYTAKVTAF